MLTRQLKDQLKSSYFHAYKLGVRLGWCVLPAHYYAAEPNIIELERTRDTWTRPSPMSGVEIDLDSQVQMLRRVCLPFQKEFRQNPHYRTASGRGFGAGFGYVEAQLLHAMLRSYKPRHIVEIGSGVSTYCAYQALSLNARGGNHPCDITCIEPYPSDALRALAEAQPSVNLIAKPVQAVELDLYSVLERGDVLFVDSSHVVRAGGDVNHIILGVLPTLAPGVLIHFHDIYFPYDYQRDVLTTFLHANETSLLHAFLMFNQCFRILFSLSHLHYERAHALSEVFPEYIPQTGTRGLRDATSRLDHHFPSSTWIESHPRGDAMITGRD
jgi:predicted O-methyltransferase YrrM